MSLRVCSLSSALVALAVGVGATSAVGAATCTVPSTPYPTIAAAVHTGACATVQLAAGVFPEHVLVSRDLVLQGAGSAATTIQGYLSASGAGNGVTLAALLVDGTATGVAGCWTSLLVSTGGAELVAGPDVVVRSTATGGSSCRLFSDAFELGTAFNWSVRSP
jgi:hypothetical protein